MGNHGARFIDGSPVCGAVTVPDMSDLLHEAAQAGVFRGSSTGTPQAVLLGVHLSRIPDYKSGQMERHFRTMQGVERLLEYPVPYLRDHADVLFQYKGVKTDNVHVFYCPLDLSNSNLIHTLVEYEWFHGMSDEHIRNHPELSSRVRRQKLGMRQPVPNFFPARRFVMLFKYEGAVRTFRGCGGNGYVSTECR